MAIAAHQLRIGQRLECTARRMTFAGRVNRINTVTVGVVLDDHTEIEVCPIWCDPLWVDGQKTPRYTANSHGGAAPKPLAGAGPAPAPGTANTASATGAAPVAAAVAIGAAPRGTAGPCSVGSGSAAAALAATPAAGSPATGHPCRLPSGDRGAAPRAKNHFPAADSVALPTSPNLKQTGAAESAPLPTTPNQEDTTMATECVTTSSKVCVRCKQPFAPRSNVQMRCEPCRELHKKQKIAEWRAAHPSGKADKRVCAHPGCDETPVGRRKLCPKHWAKSLKPGKSQRPYTTVQKPAGETTAPPLQGKSEQTLPTPVAVATAVAASAPPAATAVAASPGAGAGAAPAGGRGAEPLDLEWDATALTPPANPLQLALEAVQSEARRLDGRLQDLNAAARVLRSLLPMAEVTP